MSVWDSGEDIGPPPVPGTETRGGENIDWDKAEPGQPLPEKEPQEGRHRAPGVPADWCGTPECGGD